MSDTSIDWVELSRADEMSVAQEEARQALLSRGIRVEDLTEEVLRLDVGLDENRKTYYRVRVHQSVVAS
jgi:hypothetical protein